MIRQLLSTVLSRDGHSVRTAADGDEALALFSELPADLVITDMNMPGKDVIETVRAIRELHPAVKIIAMSADNTAQSAMSGPKGADALLTKPFKTETVLQAIQDTVGGS